MEFIEIMNMEVFMNVEITKYDPINEKNYVIEILKENDYYKEVFFDIEENYSDCIFIARYNGIVVGFLTFSGYIGRGTITTIYVSEKYRGRGIGTAIIHESDEILLKHKAVERSLGMCFNDSSLEFVKRNGYFISYSEFFMERIGGPLQYNDIIVRTYEDDDFLKWHFINETAFYIMREKTGVRPQHYWPIGQGGYDRNLFLSNKNDRYVMLIDNEIVATGSIKGNMLKSLAVRPDFQSKGLGRDLASFLVNEILRRGNKIAVTSVVNGKFAKDLYESLGFKEKSFFYNVLKFYQIDSRLHKLPDEFITTLQKYNISLLS